MALLDLSNNWYFIKSHVKLHVDKIVTVICDVTRGRYAEVEIPHEWPPSRVLGSVQTRRSQRVPWPLACHPRVRVLLQYYRSLIPGFSADDRSTGQLGGCGTEVLGCVPTSACRTAVQAIAWDRRGPHLVPCRAP
jgi:hypothetical protein